MADLTTYDEVKDRQGYTQEIIDDHKWAIGEWLSMIMELEEKLADGREEFIFARKQAPKSRKCLKAYRLLTENEQDTYNPSELFGRPWENAIAQHESLLEKCEHNIRLENEWKESIREWKRERNETIEGLKGVGEWNS